MKDHKKKEEEENMPIENASPVCYQNDPTIQDDYLLPEQKAELLKNKSISSKKKKKKDKKH